MLYNVITKFSERRINVKFRFLGSASYEQQSKSFWSKHTPDMNYMYCLVYLYALNCAVEGRNADITEFTEKFSAGEEEIRKAFLFWAEKGLLKFDDKKDEVVFYSDSPAEIRKDVQSVCEEGKTSFIDDCGKRLGRQLSLIEIKTFGDMRDWIGLEEDVIYTLIDYCRMKDKTRIRYMEKVAIDWKEKGIASEEAAVEYIHMQENEFTDIMKALGKSGYSPTKTDEKYFLKWLKELNMPLEIILEACSRTIESAGKASLRYTDKILENWKNQGVKTVKDIEYIDKMFLEKKEAGKADKAPASQNKKEWKNRFVNFPQREWDFDEMERIEAERRDKNS